MTQSLLPAGGGHSDQRSDHTPTPIVMSQGAESNLSGRWLEAQIEWHARARGIPIVNYGDDLDNGDLFHPTKLVRRVPYRSIYGSHSTSEYVLHHHTRHIRIECRCQETPGSVDEKLPFLFENARDQMPEREIIILLHGDGARESAIAWLRGKCLGVATKRIEVFNVSEYAAWFKGLLQGRR